MMMTTMMLTPTLMLLLMPMPIVIQSTAARRNWIELVSTEASCELRVLCWAVAKEASMRFLAMPSVL